MEVIRQLIKEFAVPLMAALAWMVYNLYETQPGQWGFRVAVNVFGPAFFFASWLAAQWFRVKKQQGVDKGLGTIEQSIKDTLAKLDATATQLSGHITGGDSVCYFFGPSTRDDTWRDMLVIHSGAHPLYDVVARVCDIDEFEKCRNKLIQRLPHPAVDQIVQLGNLVPEHARYSPICLSLGHGSYRRFNIFFTARNGSFTQLLRCKRVDGQWAFATRITRGNDVVLEKVDAQFLQGVSEVPWNT
jgi:hypothetical protein